MSSTNSAKRRTLYTDEADKTSETDTPQISDKDREVFKQLVELCVNAAYSTGSNRCDNHDGDVMTSKDLRVVLEKLEIQISEAEIGMLVKNTQTDGHFTLRDVIRMMQHGDFKQSELHQDRRELWETFKYFDRNGDDFISITDLQDGIDNLGLNVKSTEVYKMILGADTNGDGRIDFEEFEAMLQDDSGE